MESEKFIPYKNEDGQIIHPEVARRMADSEKMLREDNEFTPEGADEFVDTWGEAYHAEEMATIVIDKIKKTLSIDELKVIKKMLDHPDERKA
ncbi:MAG TPA: hypothetical protein PKZ16_03410, partial [bacterium]|nr:hypothetical protein [bacterium]